MRVLVVYASKYGATQGIAERVGQRLREAGLVAEVVQVADARDVPTYDAFVVGSALYYFHWRKQAVQFVRRNRDVLAERPTWLFSSGPLGTEEKDAEGSDVRVGAGPKELAELASMVQAREHHVFFGAFDRDKLRAFDRLVARMPAIHEVLPEGDFRDWAEIDAWTAAVAAELAEVPATVG